MKTINMNDLFKKGNGMKTRWASPENPKARKGWGGQLNILLTSREKTTFPVAVISIWISLIRHSP